MERQEALQAAQSILAQLRTRKKTFDYREFQHDLNLVADALQEVEAQGKGQQ